MADMPLALSRSQDHIILAVVVVHMHLYTPLVLKARHLVSDSAFCIGFSRLEALGRIPLDLGLV